MTEVLILPSDTGVASLPCEVLSHIQEKHGNHSALSLASYEALSRLSLKFHLEKSNRRLPFVRYSDYGKPFFEEYPQISFSISHSADMAAAVMSDQFEVGIDIEKIRMEKLSSYRKIAHARFFPNEQRYLSQHSSSELEEIKSFLSIWTKKEAVAKVIQIAPTLIDTTALSPDLHVKLSLYEQEYVLCVVEKER